MSEVVTFGEAMAALRGTGLLRLGGELSLSIAGAESNLAIGLARLSHDVAWIGRVGDDELGQLVLRTLRAEQVDVRAAHIDADRPTGLLLFEPRIADTVRVAYYRSGSAGGAIAAEDVLPHLRSGLRLLHVTGVTAALGPQAVDAVNAAVKHARALGAQVSLDINYRSQLWPADRAREVLRPLAAQVDLLFASDDELRLVAPDPGADTAASARQLLDSGVTTVVLKRGADGALAHTAAGELRVAARAVPVVDVVGAGDAFAAGYLSGHLDGRNVAGCLDRASVVAAFAVAQRGDWEGLPTRAELHLLDTPPGTTLR
ncbi:MAG TPA: sugar kinase [Jatrophihabitans sp.]|jgi:2-dehydro-3-deoxygluconokinase|nr:sugar kinase [Jatrophihabitans sp.]